MIAAKIKQEQIILPYLKYAWVQPSTRKQIEAVAKTTNGTFKINQTTLGNIKVPVPPHKIQQEFADFVRQVDKSRFAGAKIGTMTAKNYAENYAVHNKYGCIPGKVLHGAKEVAEYTLLKLQELYDSLTRKYFAL